MMHQMFSIVKRSRLQVDQFSTQTLLPQSHAAVMDAVFCLLEICVCLILVLETQEQTGEIFGSETEHLLWQASSAGLRTTEIW